MSENLQNATTVEAPVTEQAVLPSEEAEQSVEEQEQVNPYDLSGFKDEDGKLAGKFDTAEDLMKSYNEAQEYIKRINAERAREGSEKAKQSQEQATQAELKAIEDRLYTEFADGEASEDTIAKAKELGFSDEKIELSRYKTQEAVSRIVKEVGSMENYKEMMTTLASTLTDAEKAEFNSMINTSQGSEIALLGLKAKYEKLVGDGGNQDRIRGDVKPKTTRGYQTQAEMLADLAMLRRNPNNKALVASYEAKKAMTSDDVIFGRK